MEDVEELRSRLTTERPEAWDQMPDIPLYLDQVIAYMSRQLIDLSESEKVTASMAHNYAKEGLMPRSAGKRYGREHIAYLTAICVLKEVLQVRDVKTLLRAAAGEQEDARGVYGKLLEMLDEEETQAAELLPESGGREELERSALRLAVSAYARGLACRELIRLLDDPEGKK